MKPRANKRMFAMAHAPAQVTLAGATYRLVRVFKHDFFAATCLYEVQPSANATLTAGPSIVVKFGREQSFFGLPMQWAGRLLARRERDIYGALGGVTGVPRFLGMVGPSAFAVECIDGIPLDHKPGLPGGFFDRLADVYRAVHDRGVAYCDGNKRSNVMIDRAGAPVLIDFQISIRRRDDLPWPVRSLMRAAVAYMQRQDIYFLCKHKRRFSPGELTEREAAILDGPPGLGQRLFRLVWGPVRFVRRTFLRSQYRKGRLVSPTADLEDRYQPEKQTWR